VDTLTLACSRDFVEGGTLATVSCARIRVYAELNDFVARDRRGREFVHAFLGTPSVKDVIEAIGIPHGEVELVLVNGASVGLAHRVGDGDLLSVYPVFESLDVSDLVRVRPAPLRVSRFVLDGHLGRLAAKLRMLGFDTKWSAHAQDPELAEASAVEQRILLTRDLGLLKRSRVTHGYFVRATRPQGRHDVRAIRPC
jgi:uncharacterized protein